VDLSASSSESCYADGPRLGQRGFPGSHGLHKGHKAGSQFSRRVLKWDRFDCQRLTTGDPRARKRRGVAEIDEATIRVHIEPLEEGGYVATSPDVPGLVAEGRSVVEAVEIAQGLTRKIMESCLDHGDSIPPALARVKRTKLDLVVPVGVR
jgi:antitoxin HicB